MALAVYAGYLVQGEYKHSGLMGWLEAVSLRRFGEAWSLLDGLVAFVLFGLCVLILKRALRVPRLDLAVPKEVSPPRVGSAPHPKTASPLDGLPGLLLGIAIAAVGIPTFLVVQHANAETSIKVPPSPLDLDSFAGNPPASARVALDGWFQTRLIARYVDEEYWPGKNTRVSERYTHTFVPVTSSAWKPGEPVSFILETVGHREPRDEEFLVGGSVQWSPGEDPAAVMKKMNDVRAPAAVTRRTVDVRLRADDLPYFVKDAYERAGMRFSDKYWVAETGESEGLFLLGALGSFVGLVSGITLGVMSWSRRVRH